MVKYEFAPTKFFLSTQLRKLHTATRNASFM